MGHKRLVLMIQLQTIVWRSSPGTNSHPDQRGRPPPWGTTAELALCMRRLNTPNCRSLRLICMELMSYRHLFGDHSTGLSREKPPIRRGRDAACHVVAFGQSTGFVRRAEEDSASTPREAFQSVLLLMHRPTPGQRAESLLFQLEGRRDTL